MRMIPADKICHWLMPPLIAATIMLSVIPALAGPYLDSAHGNNSYGVDRSSLDLRYADYATGNCAHCHEMHASLEGSDPAPATGPSAHTLFAPAFNTDRTQNPYVDSDNFCFYCHGSAGPAVVNQDYSAVFGGAANGSGPQSVLEAFNQSSYHNLYDIKAFLDSSPTFSAWFADIGNPCSACHNSHLAKRNWDSGQAGFPLLSAISRPGDSDTLWGEVELMSSHFGYEAPFDIAGTTREPAGLGDVDGTNTPDYVGFCTTCHNATNIITSTTLGRDLKIINWGSVGDNRDQHGPIARDSDGVIHLREPYASAAAVKGNFFMSCLDCHEAHGSENTMMLRRRINGENLEAPVVSTDTMSNVCKRCHTDDLAAAAGTGQADRWEFVHHVAADAPYSAPGQCGNCHVGGAGGDPIACGNCHGHGMDDSWAPTQATGRNTF